MTICRGGWRIFLGFLPPGTAESLMPQLASNCSADRKLCQVPRVMLSTRSETPQRQKSSTWKSQGWFPWWKNSWPVFGAGLKAGYRGMAHSTGWQHPPPAILPPLRGGGMSGSRSEGLSAVAVSWQESGSGSCCRCAISRVSSPHGGNAQTLFAYVLSLLRTFSGRSLATGLRGILSPTQMLSEKSHLALGPNCLRASA